MNIAIQIIVTLYLMLLFIAGLTGSNILWGVSHLEYFPRWSAIVLSVAALMIVWLPETASRLVSSLSNRYRISRPMSLVLLAAGTGVVVALLVVARSNNHLLGDGYTVLSNVRNPDLLLPTEMLDILTHRLVYYLLGDAGTAYAMVSIAAGILFLATVAVYARRLTAPDSSVFPGLLIFLGLAQMQFFFGYVESYTVMTLFASVFLFLGWQSIRGKAPIWWPTVALCLSGAFHLSGLFLLPGLLYLYRLRSRSESRPIFAVLAVVTAGAALAAATLFYLKYQGEQIFCPLVRTELNPYSMFSQQHIMDIANILLLVAPLPLILVAVALIDRDSRSFFKLLEVKFFTFCCAGAFLFTCIVDPKIGAYRDWDLLSIYGVPLAFLATALASKATPLLRRKSTIVTAAVAVAMLHVGPWIGSNTLKFPTKEKAKRVVAKDIHYSPAYFEGYRLTSWGFLMGAVYNDSTEKARAFEVRVEGKPDDHRSWLTYAMTLYDLDLRQEALAAVRNVTDLEQLFEVNLQNLAQLQFEFRMLDEARRTLDYTLEYYPENLKLLLLAGAVYHLLDDDSSAVQFYGRALAKEPDNVECLINWATSAVALGDLDKADSLLSYVDSIPGLSESDRQAIRTVKIFLESKRNCR